MTLTRLPAGASGPATRQMVSSMRTVPDPSMIGFSSVNSRPTSAAVRLLRKGLLWLERLWLDASRRQTGTAASANSANIRSCACHCGCTAKDTRPTSSAASPNQNRKTPGAANSSAIRMKPKISQFQVPNVENISVMTRPFTGSLLRRHRRRGTGDRHRGSTARGGLRRQRAFAEGRLRDLADTGERTEQACRLHRQHDELLVRRLRELAERLNVLVGDEVVERGDVAPGDRVRHHLGRLGLGLRRTFARLGVAEGGLAAAFRLQDLALLGALGAQDFGLPLTFRLQNVGALDALGLHLAAHRLDEIGRRYDVLDLDAVDLHAPWRDRGIDDAQQALVD